MERDDESDAHGGPCARQVEEVPEDDPPQPIAQSAQPEPQRVTEREVRTQAATLGSAAQQAYAKFKGILVLPKSLMGIRKVLLYRKKIVCERIEWWNRPSTI